MRVGQVDRNPPNLISCRYSLCSPTLKRANRLTVMFSPVFAERLRDHLRDGDVRIAHAGLIQQHRPARRTIPACRRRSSRRRWRACLSRRTARGRSRAPCRARQQRPPRGGRTSDRRRRCAATIPSQRLEVVGARHEVGLAIRPRRARRLCRPCGCSCRRRRSTWPARRAWRRRRVPSCAAARSPSPRCLPPRVSAALHSIIPAPVFSRSRFTCSAVIVIVAIPVLPN